MVENKPFLTFLTHLVLIVGVVVVVFPVYLAFIASTREASDFLSGLTPLLPGPHLLENYGRMLNTGLCSGGAPPVWMMLANSLLMSVIIADGKTVI